MEVLYPRCAGLDVHKKTVVAAIRIATESVVVTEVKTFATTTAGLLALLDWLLENGCTHAAMEATGVYWKPVWHVLSAGEIELVLANAAHVKNVPGRKTDVSDAAWLAELMAHGLIRASFVPDPQTQELRVLLRTRKQLVRERTRHVQRINKALEDANIKLDTLLSDLLGLSGRTMLDAMVAGETDPARLAALAHPSVKCSRADLAEALRGRLTRHHRFLLQLHLGQIDGLKAAVAAVDREVEANLEPFRVGVVPDHSRRCLGPVEDGCREDRSAGAAGRVAAAAAEGDQERARADPPQERAGATSGGRAAGYRRRTGQPRLRGRSGGSTGEGAARCREGEGDARRLHRRRDRLAPAQCGLRHGNEFRRHPVPVLAAL